MDNENQNPSLLEQLMNYSASDAYPFHMPGHKRRGAERGVWLPSPFSIDITEIHGFDNLHHAEGILRDSMAWAARCYGADESCYLVNGSSCGILSAVCGCTSRRGKILISRNCHKSIYHGVFLNELQTEYVYPQILPELGIQGGILPEDVEKKLEEHPDIEAVMIVSPTYDGMVSDIKRIAEVAHRHGVPLVVDEAHGAHFPFGHTDEGGFPKSALELGADVVIQSLHKTLPSLTQTAILHMKRAYLGQERMERIKRYLSIYQSSSPSYVFMASIETCIRYMNQQGRERMPRFHLRLQEFRKRCETLRYLYVPGREWIGKSAVYDMDDSKILMFTGWGGKSGLWLEEFLRERHHLELEMCAAQYGLALTSLWDDAEGFERLWRGLQDADQAMSHEMDQIEKKNRDEKRTWMTEGGQKAEWNRNQEFSGKTERRMQETDRMEKLPIRTGISNGNITKGSAYKEAEAWKTLLDPVVPKTICRISDAMDRPYEELDLKDCEGAISAEFVYLYPPGIPYLVPGEIISNEMILKLVRFRQIGFSLQGIQDLSGKKLRIIKLK